MSGQSLISIRGEAKLLGSDISSDYPPNFHRVSRHPSYEGPAPTNFLFLSAPMKDIVFSFGPDPNLFCISAQGVTKW